MKNTLVHSVLSIVALAVLSLSSCKKDSCVQSVTYKTYLPVYMSYEDLRKSVKSEGPQPLKHPGKIYLNGNYLFVNEVDKGIHIFNNTNPAAPQNIAFIKIPGNLDLAAVGNTLYADSYIDLLAIDISNPSQISVLKRVEDALPQRYYSYSYNIDPLQGVVADWDTTLVTEELSTDCYGTPIYSGPWFEDGIMFTANGSTTKFVSPSAGIGGSTARFTITGNALYIVDNTKLNVYDISAYANPTKVSETALGWSIETIYPYKNKLFIGSRTAFHIFNNANPLSPVYVSSFDHVTACDPVVVDDDYAYFTLSGGTPCNRGVNQLEVVDITDIANPYLKTTVAMTDPKGVGIDNKKLFVCDGNAGLKIYDATDVMQLQNSMVSNFTGINAYDVIPYNNTLLMTGTDGIYQYDYTNINQVTLLSRIAIGN